MKRMMFTCFLFLAVSCYTPPHETIPAVTAHNIIFVRKNVPREDRAPRNEIADLRGSACKAGERELEIRYTSPDHEIYSFNFKVEYNPGVTTLTKAIGGNFLGTPEKDNRNIAEGDGNGRVIFFAHEERKGEINIGLSLLGDVPGKKGENSLAVLCFTVLRPNTPSGFRIRDIKLSGSISSVLLYDHVVEKGGGISFLSRLITTPSNM